MEGDGGRAAKAGDGMKPDTGDGTEPDRFDELPAVALPIDPEEGRRIRRRRSAKRRIEPLVVVWLVSHVVPYLAAYFFSESLPAPNEPHGRLLLSLLAASQWFALFVAGAAAVVTIRNWSVLSRGWIVGGLFPWAVFVGEITFMFVMTRL